MKRLVLALLLCVCSDVLQAQDSVVIRMDPDNVLGGSVSQIFDSVEYVPLETTKESLFGRIDQLIVTDSLYYILDRSSDQILMFRKNGKFFSRIQMQRYVKTASGQGINHFMVDESTKRIIANHQTNQDALYIFNFQGKLTNTLTGIHWENMASIGEDKYLMTTRGDVTDTITGRKGNCIIVDHSLQRFEKMVFSALPNVYTGSGADVHGGASAALYVRAYDYTIYEVALTGIAKQYKFRFPAKYSLPSNFLDSSFIKRQASYPRDENPTVIMGLETPLSSGKFLSFKLVSWGGFFSPYIYSNRSKNIYSMWNVTTDSAHYYLPCFYTYGQLLGDDGENFYSYVPVYQFKMAYEENLKSRKQVYPAHIQQLYSSLKRYDNPILVKLKPKEGI